MVLLLSLFCDASLPPLWLEVLLPDKETASKACEINRAFQCHLYAMDDVWRRDSIEDLIALNRKHYAWWDSIRDEHMMIPVYSRRRALKEIIDGIGWENYLAGRWPLPIPVD